MGKKTAKGKPSGLAALAAMGGAAALASGIETGEVQSDMTALILADSFDQRFMPITKQVPRALIPVVNRPLLDYTIEFLVSSGVVRIFVLACSHADQIADYIEKRQWDCQISPIVSKNLRSVGDALREVYHRSLIDDDFVLVSGDVISNMNVGKIFAEHKARRKADPATLMTMVVKKASLGHRARSLEDDAVLAIDRETRELVVFSPGDDSRIATVPSGVLIEHPHVDLHNDLLDCRIDICSPEVLSLFVDNFDFQTLRSDFVADVLSDQELLGLKVFTHIISGEYAARVKDLKTYHGVSVDILNRWTFPMVPDAHFGGETNYKHSRPNNYREPGVSLSKSCLLEGETVIGAGTSVGHNTVVRNTIIGRNCVIGENVQLTDAFLWDGVVIEDGSTIDSSILCGCRVLRESQVGPDALVSFGVVVGPKAQVRNVKLTKAQLDEDDYSEEKLVEIDLGVSGQGMAYECGESRCDSLVANNSFLNESIVTLSWEDYPIRGRSGSTTREEKGGFASEVSDTMRRGDEEGVSLENITLEINGLKLTFDQTFVQTGSAVLVAALERLDWEQPHGALVQAIKEELPKWAPLLQKYISSEDDQVDFIYELQTYCESGTAAARAFGQAFQFILHVLYDNETLDEEAIIKWANEIRENNDADEKVYVKRCEAFLQWLEDAEEDSDEDCESDEESDSDED